MHGRRTHAHLSHTPSHLKSRQVESQTRAYTDTHTHSLTHSLTFESRQAELQTRTHTDTHKLSLTHSLTFEVPAAELQTRTHTDTHTHTLSLSHALPHLEPVGCLRDRRDGGRLVDLLVRLEVLVVLRRGRRRLQRMLARSKAGGDGEREAFRELWVVRGLGGRVLVSRVAAVSNVPSLTRHLPDAPPTVCGGPC